MPHCGRGTPRDTFRGDRSHAPRRHGPPPRRRTAVLRRSDASGRAGLRGSGRTAEARTVTRLVRALLALAVVPALVLTAAPAAAAPVQPRGLPAPVDDAYETRIVQLVNAERAAVGLRRLVVSTCADRAAQDWSARMVRTSVFAHRPSLGTLLGSCRASAVGENIASGSISADRMMAMWMASPGHRANVLDPRFTHVGVAAARTATGRTYGTQVFLRQ